MVITLIKVLEFKLLGILYIEFTGRFWLHSRTPSIPKNVEFINILSLLVIEDVELSSRSFCKR